ncbi:MAG TPA: SOS response-associated peptidase [Trueperaceae bacterium]|nr:SOS response-associated peptidase [Trueperaceae bacterium]
MCGRYTLYGHEDDLASLFEVDTYPLTARYNIAPTQEVPVVRQRPDGSRELSAMRWGLVPHWVKDPLTFKANLFNARSESAAEKPSFRDAMRSARCIVPASGFYEWQQRGRSKQPYHVVRNDGAPMAIAGLWATNTRGPQPLTSCTILTAAANDDVASLHDRMPVILEREAWALWLDHSETEPDRLEALLAPAAPVLLRIYPVSREVGNARVDKPELCEPWSEGLQFV